MIPGGGWFFNERNRCFLCLLVSWFSKPLSLLFYFKSGCLFSPSVRVWWAQGHVHPPLKLVVPCVIASGSAKHHKLIWAEPTSLHPQRPWSSYTNINQGKPTGCTHTVEAGVWVSIPSRHTGLRCTSASCPQMSVTMGTWSCPCSSQSQDKPVLLGGQRKYSSWHLSSWCTETKGKSARCSICVCLYIHGCIPSICIWMHAYTYIRRSVCTHKTQMGHEIKREYEHWAYSSVSDEKRKSYFKKETLSP